MPTKHKVLIEVLVDDKEQFLSVKVEGGQQCPLPKDAPAPRRLVQDLLTAALDEKHPANRTSDETVRLKNALVQTGHTDGDRDA